MKKVLITTGMKNNEITLAASYYNLIAEAGLMPVIAAPGLKPLAHEDYAALLLTDGPDLASIFYNEEPLPELGETDPIRDEFEIDLCKEAQAAQLPILGIGRGCQLINVALGGSLYQDIYLQDSGAGIQHMQKTSLNTPSHHANLAPNSFLQQALGDKAFVNSHHHQAIKQLGQGLQATAQAYDGVTEGIENQLQTVIGVQWRPDLLTGRFAENKLWQLFFTKIK
jgi:putative glutamine amidotransferase